MSASPSPPSINPDDFWNWLKQTATGHAPASAPGSSASLDQARAALQKYLPSLTSPGQYAQLNDYINSNFTTAINDPALRLQVVALLKPYNVAYADQTRVVPAKYSNAPLATTPIAGTPAAAPYANKDTGQGGTTGGGSTGSGSAPTPNYSNVVDEFGRPASQNYANTVGQDQARVLAQQSGGQGGQGSGQPVEPPAPAATPTALPTTGGGGNNNGIPSVNNQAILQSPDEMLRIVLQRMGINQPLSGPFADFFKQRLSQIVDSAAHIGTLGVGGQSGSQIDNLQNILGSLASSAQGGHFMGDLAGIAGQGLNALRTNPLLTNAPYTQQNELLQRINALNEVGMSPYAAAGLENMYQQGTNDYMAQARQKPAYEMGTGAFPKFLGGTALGQYYGMQP